jgi:DNA-binding response OmpR family regulator
MSALVLVVHRDPRALRHTEALLSDQGLLVAALSSFTAAKHLLDSVMPDLLIADVRLERYNGLQLAIWNQMEHPDVPVIITSNHPDPITEAEARRYGASFVATPLENADFLPAVQDALAARRRALRPVRRWLRRPANAVVELEAADARAKILDLSYGGVRLAFKDAGPIPTMFNITLPFENMMVRALRVWTAESEDENETYCGAELTKADAERWRDFVDSLQEAAPDNG